MAKVKHSPPHPERTAPASRVVRRPRVTTTTARSSLSDLVSLVLYRGERVILSRRGKPAAALVSVDDLELLEELEDRMDLDAARAAIAEAKERGTTSWDKLKAELGV